MAAVHHFETVPARSRARERAVLWAKDAAAALGLVAFIAACFVLAYAAQAFL
jgi:hypothetical protein